jgi:hypothetical protein
VSRPFSRLPRLDDPGVVLDDGTDVRVEVAQARAREVLLTVEAVSGQFRLGSPRRSAEVGGTVGRVG